jgi:hypothetical protein
LALLVVVLLITMLVWGGSRAPDVILKELARMTPLGSTVPEVEAALQKRGLHEGMCWSEDKDGTKAAIKVRYADFYRLGLPPPRTIIEAQWHFDDAGKLSDISLDYYSSGMLAFGFTKETEKPFLLSAVARD